MSYKKAFRCGKCPESNGEQGCPMWWEIMETEINTNEKRVNKGCGYVLLPGLLVETIRVAGSPAASIDKIATVLASGLKQVVQMEQKKLDV